MKYEYTIDMVEEKDLFGRIQDKARENWEPVLLTTSKLFSFALIVIFKREPVASVPPIKVLPRELPENHQFIPLIDKLKADLQSIYDVLLHEHVSADYVSKAFDEKPSTQMILRAMDRQ